MDIQKEGELFEIWWENHGQYNRAGGGDYEKTFAWESWIAAKAQVDQKVKLLLCDEHLKKCESPTGIFNSQYPDEEPCLICLAKEAKAQAVPEGFVLVPKNPTHKMMEASWASLDAGSADEWWDVYEEVMKAAQEPAND